MFNDSCIRNSFPHFQKERIDMKKNLFFPSLLRSTLKESDQASLTVGRQYLILKPDTNQRHRERFVPTPWKNERKNFDFFKTGNSHLSVL